MHLQLNSPNSSNFLLKNESGKSNKKSWNVEGLQVSLKNTRVRLRIIICISFFEDRLAPKLHVININFDWVAFSLSLIFTESERKQYFEKVRNFLRAFIFTTLSLLSESHELIPSTSLINIFNYNLLHLTDW